METGDARHRWQQIASAAAPGHAVRRVITDDDPRRRAAVLVGGRRRRPAAIVKIGRTPLEGDRGSAEQRRLHALDDVGVTNVPRPLGAGSTDGLAWSVESWEPGERWDVASRRWRRRHEPSMLDAFATWLDALASRTAHARSTAMRECDLPLRPPAIAHVDAVRGVLDAAPAVLAHGDLASGTNVLVDGPSFTVIDWETAMDDGVPLVDLLPTLALALARASVGGSPEARADYVLALCRGDNPESAWLFSRVDRHLRALGIAAPVAGPLALAAWGYQASMRARHDELVRATGEAPLAWTSPAELVLTAWVEDPALGVDWPALRTAAA